jgi:hypothetical protein
MRARRTLPWGAFREFTQRRSVCSSSVVNTMVYLGFGPRIFHLCPQYTRNQQIVQTRS